MASVEHIKKHIKSVEDTHKITNAMYLIASTKLRKAKSDLDHTRPYFNALQAQIKRIFRINSDLDNKYFYPIDNTWKRSDTYACLVITADKGLAGAYNQNVIKETKKLIDEHPKTKLFVLGEYGRHYFEEHNVKIEQSFIYTASNPTMHRAREISSILLDLYDKNKVGKIYVIYTDLKSGLVGEAKSTRLIPFHRAQFSDVNNDKKVVHNLQFYPSLTEVLDNIMQSYISGYIYSALVDSFCCEQEARMQAMNSANDNAIKLLDELSIQYNRVRQAGITQEITEISAGAKARKRKDENVWKTEE